MRKLISVILISGMCLLMAACGTSGTQNSAPASAGAEVSGSGGSDTGINILDPQSIISIDEEPVDVEAIKANFDKASALVESLVDTSNMTVDNDDQGEDGMYRYWYVDEIPREIKLSDEISIDGKTITIAKTLIKDLSDLGFEVEKFSDTVNPQEIQSVNINKGDKTFILSSMPNETDQPMQLDDMPVFELNSGSLEYAIPFDYMGITPESKIEDVLDILGVPNSALNLSSSGVNTSIEFGYVNESREGDKLVNKILSFDFVYDADTDSAHLSSILYSRNEYPAEE